MKAIFIANNKGNVDYVYGQKNIDKIATMVELDKEVYCEEDIIASPEKFKDVEIAFSTWSMPGGGEIKLTDYLPKLKVLFYAAGSIKYFANEYFEKGIRITSAFAANAIPVAEYTVGQILLANKGFFQSAIATKNKEYQFGNKIAGAHAGNYEAKIGIVGAGMIGRKVIELLKPYKLDIMVFDKFMSDEQAKALGVTKCTLDEIFEECDVVSNHLANVPQTIGIMTKAHFAKMKQNATFINTGRGPQLDEQGLAEVLKERQDLCALLDVTIKEPLDDDSEFYNLPNAFLTSHIAGSMSNEVRRMSELMIDELDNYLNGRDMQFEITAEKLAKMA